MQKFINNEFQLVEFAQLTNQELAQKSERIAQARQSFEKIKKHHLAKFGDVNLVYPYLQKLTDWNFEDLEYKTYMEVYTKINSEYNDDIQKSRTSRKYNLRFYFITNENLLRDFKIVKDYLSSKSKNSSMELVKKIEDKTNFIEAAVTHNQNTEKRML